MKAKKKRILVDEHIRLTKAAQPLIFTIENVPEFLTRSNGLYLNKVLEGLSEYEITHTLVTDSNVGGYTTRKRAIITGALKESGIGKIVIPNCIPHPIRCVKDALDKVTSDWFNYNDISQSSSQTQQALSHVPQGGNWKCIPETVKKFKPTTHSNRYYRLDPNGLAPTLCNWRKAIIAPPVGNRILSVAEASSLFGLTKEFKILGKNLDTRQQQVANGVTFSVATLIMKTIQKALDWYYSKESVVMV